MALSDQVIRDGDMGFLGFASRLNPTTLPAGMLQESVNMRLDRGVAQTRKGAKRLADDISTEDEPLTVPFTLAADVAVSTITFVVDVATVTTAAVHGYTTGDFVNIRGATGDDDAFYNGDFVITVTSTTVFTYTMTGAPDNNATGTLLANAGPVVRTTYGGGIFAAGVFASENFENAQEYIVLCGPDEAFFFRQDTALITKGYPADETIDPTDTVSVVQAFDRLYVLREADRTAAGFGVKLTTASGIAVAGTVGTVHVTGHGYVAGMRVRIEGSVVAGLESHEFEVQTAGANSFTITVLSGTAADAVAGRKVRRVKAPIFYDGGTGGFVKAVGGVPAEGASFRTMRSVGFARYINNRLVIPDGRNSVLVSDVLDADLYDPFFQSLRVGVGGDDFIVGIEPYIEGAVLVFCRKSIWIAAINQQFTAGQAESVVVSISMLTNEIGCSARNTIARAGQFIFFLSDAGVYQLDAQLDLKLRGDTLPLSDPIANLFANIDQDKVFRAVGLWHDNRYLLAVPTTSGPGDDTNNLVVAWNSLTNQWEYQDEYGIGVDDLLVSTFDNERRVFNARRTGKLYLLDENEDGTDDAPTPGFDGAVVAGRITTRRLNFKEMSSKRFLRSVTDVLIPAGGGLTTTVNVIDPDRSEQIGSITNNTGVLEDFHLKAPIRFKAHAVELTLTTTGQRPSIRSVAIEASPKSLPATLTRNES